MRDSDLKQRLVAILAADAAGYSRLMAGDDRATVVALDTARTICQALVEGTLLAHDDGRSARMR